MPFRFPRKSPLKLAVLISGTGRSLRNLIEKIKARILNAEIHNVIATSIRAPGLQYAEQNRLPISLVSPPDTADVRNPPQFGENHSSVWSFSDSVFTCCRQVGADLVVLAGYTPKLKIPEDFAYRVITSHPALTPAFSDPQLFGLRVHEAVLQYGVKITGCTIHFVDDSGHCGPVIFQQDIPVLEDDTVTSLEARVFAVECDLLPHAINLIAAGRVEVEGRQVRILP